MTVLDPNFKTYQCRNIVQYYAQLSAIQPAEQTILDRLSEQLPKMKMLDIGVGGGRTTLHFAPHVAEYTGIDYSPEMIAVCERRFQAKSSSWSFRVCDARNMQGLGEAAFDLVLFSFNGMDYIPHGDRLGVLAEIRRVLKPGGYFCFSSHNLVAMAREFRVSHHLCWNLFSVYINLMMWMILRWHNRTLNSQMLAEADYALIRDEPHNFRLHTYYVRPQEQIRQLLGNGFGNIQVFSWKTGIELTDSVTIQRQDDLWLYYLCQAGFGGSQ